MNTNTVVILLIALVIVCVTITINTIISNNYLSLKKRWNNRVNVLCNVVINIGRLKETTDKLMEDDSIPEDAKRGLQFYTEDLDILLADIKDYEKEEF